MIGHYGPAMRYQSGLRPSCAGYCRVDGIQAASGSLLIEDDGCDPVCQLCHRAPVDYECSVCGKLTCSTCGHVYTDGVFCDRHVPDLEEAAA